MRFIHAFLFDPKCKSGIYIVTDYFSTSYEINASVSESGYTIKSHYYAMPKEEEFIKVGQLCI